MQKFLLNLVNKIFTFQERILKKKYTGHISTKSHVTGSAILTIKGKIEERKEEVKNKVSIAARKNRGNPAGLFNEIRNEGAEIFIIKNASKFLKIINEETGLIFPQRGLKALYINLFTQFKFSFAIPCIFILEDLNEYTILYNFYKLCAYNASLPGAAGYDKIKNIDKLYNSIGELNYKEIMLLKDVIARDKEAVNFVMGFIKENIEAEKIKKVKD